MRSESQEAKRQKLGLLEVDEVEFALFWINGIGKNKVASVKVARAKMQLGFKVDYYVVETSFDKSLRITIRNTNRNMLIADSRH